MPSGLLQGVSPINAPYVSLFGDRCIVTVGRITEGLGNRGYTIYILSLAELKMDYYTRLSGSLALHSHEITTAYSSLKAGCFAEPSYSSSHAPLRAAPTKPSPKLSMYSTLLLQNSRLLQYMLNCTRIGPVYPRKTFISSCILIIQAGWPGPDSRRSGPSSHRQS